MRSPTPAKVSHSAGDVSVDAEVIFMIWKHTQTHYTLFYWIHFFNTLFSVPPFERVFGKLVPAFVLSETKKVLD